MMANPVKPLFPLRVCTAQMPHVWRFAQRIAFTEPRMASSCTTRKLALVVVIVCLPAHLVRLNFQSLALLASVGKWTNVPSVQVVLCPMVHPRKKNSMAQIGLPKASCPLCAEFCSTKALLAGDAEKISNIFRKRVVERGAKGGVGRTQMISLTTHPTKVNSRNRRDEYPRMG